MSRAPVKISYKGRLLEFEREPSARRLADAHDSLLESGAVPDLKRAPDPKLAPLTSAQESLWVLSQMEQGKRLYVEQFGIAFDGALDIPMLTQALAAVVERQSALRTTFEADNGFVYQRLNLADRCRPEFEVVEIHADDEATRDLALREHAVLQLDEPLDIEHGPLIRFRLLKFDLRDHVLLLSLHHIVFDAASAAILTRDLARVYDALCRRTSDDEPPVPTCSELRAFEDGGPGVGPELRAGGYWRDRFADDIPTLELPFARPRPPEPSYRGDSVRVELDPRLLDGLRNLGRRHHATLFVVLLTTFKALLCRYTGQPDVVIGTAQSRRSRATRNAVGCFVNLLPLRTNLAGDPSFSDALGRVRDTCLDAFRQKEVPFARIVQMANRPRDRGRHPILQVTCNHVETMEVSVSLPRLTITSFLLPDSLAEFDLMLDLLEGPDGPWLKWQFASDLFDRPTIERMAGHLLVLFAAVVANPTLRLSELPLVTADEHRRIRAANESQASQPAAPYPLHELVARHAALDGARVAVCAGVATLTYGELQRRVTGLTALLWKREVMAEASVVVCVADPSQAVVTALAVTAAGGICVPLDPSHPDARLRSLVEASGASVAIVDCARAAALAAPLETVRIDEEWEGIEAGTEEPQRQVEGAQLAFASFTSGPGGVPSLVGISHGALVKVACSLVNLYGLVPGDRFLLPAVLDARAYLADVFPSLACGATLAGGGTHPADARGFLRLVTSTEVAVSAVPGRVWQELATLASAGEVEVATSLRTVAVRASSLDPSDVCAWTDAVPGVRVVAVGGPPEIGCGTMVGVAGGPVGLTGAAVSVVRPRLGASAFVLDRSFGLASIGVPGELCVGGGWLARGYLGRPGATAERFVPAPGQCPGDRAYRTGAQARYLADGRIELIAGTLDARVEIDGVGVDPREVEAQLAAHPAVREAHVVALASGDGATRLVAFVAGDMLDEVSLADDVARRLPAPMVPSAFVETDAPWQAGLRDGLSRESAGEPNFAEEHELEAPVDPLEHELAELWIEVLGVDRVGRHDDFFELGGHSLRAIQLAARAEQRRIPLRLDDVFTYSTVSELAAQARDRMPAVERGALSARQLAIMAELEEERNNAEYA